MTIVKNSIVIHDSDVDKYFTKLNSGILENRYGIGSKIEIEKSDHLKYLQVYGYDLYVGEGLLSTENRTKEKRVYIWFEEMDEYIKITIQIDSIKWKNQKRNIITNQDLYFPMIIDKISRDLTGELAPNLIGNLYLDQTKNILRTEKFSFFLLLLIILLLPSILTYDIMLYLVFGGIAILVLYNILYLLINKKKNA